GIPRQYRAALRIALANNLERRLFTDGSKNPFGVKRHRQTPGSIVLISHRQAHQLNRSIGRDENHEVLIEITTVMRVASVALAMSNGHRCGWSKRQGCRCPEVTGFLVAQIDHFTWRVGSGIIGPGSEAVHLTIACPAV